MLVLYCEEKGFKCTSKKCAGLIFSRSWCLFKRDIGGILSLKRCLVEEVFWSQVLFFFSCPARSWYVYLLDTRFLSFRVLAFVFLFSRRACFCWHVYLPQWGCQMDLSLSPVQCLSLSFSFLFFFHCFFFLWCVGWYSVSSCLNVLEGESCEKYPDSPLLVKRELLCHGQGLARSLLPSAVVRRNSTAINCRSLLMFTSVLSGTLVTGSCSEEHLRSKDSLLIGIPGPGNASWLVKG